MDSVLTQRELNFAQAKALKKTCRIFRETKDGVIETRGERIQLEKIFYQQCYDFCKEKKES